MWAWYPVLWLVSSWIKPNMDWAPFSYPIAGIVNMCTRTWKPTSPRTSQFSCDYNTLSIHVWESKN
jgi:hypothetical protein